MSVRRQPQVLPPPTLKYGDRFGDYVINGFAGTGATSYVYRARRHDSFEPVAIKVLHPHLLKDTIKRRRFLREAQVMMRFEHPNIVNFHEIVDTPTELAFVMEYIEGETLEDWRKMYADELDEAVLACVFVDILRGLSQAHRTGVVHRDLKPANILITYLEGRFVAKIIDFGVARVLSEAMAQDERAKIVGTAAYISPEEVLDPERVGPTSDLYSLGVMLYEAACGERPFEGMPVRDLMQAHVHEAPVRPRAINPHLTPAFESVILRTLEKTPDGRFGSAPEMIRALEIAITSAMEMSDEAWAAQMDEAAVTTEWHREIERMKEREHHPVVGFLRRCVQSAFLLFTSTGATQRSSDPHHLSRHHDLPLPLG